MIHLVWIGLFAFLFGLSYRFLAKSIVDGGRKNVALAVLFSLASALAITARFSVANTNRRQAQERPMNPADTTSATWADTAVAIVLLTDIP